MRLSVFSWFCLFIACGAFTSAPAEDNRTTTPGHIAFYDASDGRTLQNVLDELGERVPALGYPEAALLASGETATRAYFTLVDASPAGVRQAVCHAARWWWATTDAGKIRLTRDMRVELGKQTTRVLPSTLVDADWCETPVRQLLAPWLGPSTGVLYDPDDGSWSASLDAAGHARLLEAISLFEQPQVRAPALVPDAETPDPDRALPALPLNAWSDLLRAGAVNGISISLASELAQQPPPGGTIPAGSCGSLPERCRVLGWKAGWSHGVLCLAGAYASNVEVTTVEDRQLPALRRRIAWLPVAHLVHTPADGLALAAALQRAMGPWLWRPGAGLWYLEKTRAMLVAADTPTIHTVLDALALVDRYGLEEALARMAITR